MAKKRKRERMAGKERKRKREKKATMAKRWRAAAAGPIKSAPMHGYRWCCASPLSGPLPLSLYLSLPLSLLIQFVCDNFNTVNYSFKVVILSVLYTMHYVSHC
jgi:hypothetical protein